MFKKNKICQSCGMPLKKDKQGGGTEKDGSISLSYCSHCYSKGKFTNPNDTVEKMQKFSDQKMTEMKLPKFMRKIFLKKIPKLGRWKNKN